MCIYKIIIMPVIEQNIKFLTCKRFPNFFCKMLKNGPSFFLMIIN